MPFILAWWIYSHRCAVEGWAVAPERYHHIPEMTDDDLQHIITEWTNMSGFLCSLGDVATGGHTVRPLSTVPSASSVESLTNLSIYSSTR